MEAGLQTCLNLFTGCKSNLFDPDFQELLAGAAWPDVCITAQFHVICSNLLDVVHVMSPLSEPTAALLSELFGTVMQGCSPSWWDPSFKGAFLMPRG